jgi:hypothetical protein
MLLEQLKANYGTYDRMNKALDLAPTTYLNWKKRGGIPFKTQLLISEKTKGKFKALRAHDPAEN